MFNVPPQIEKSNRGGGEGEKRERNINVIINKKQNKIKKHIEYKK